MDLLLGIYLPFTNPGKGIQQLQTDAGPRYLANRGIALGYRDLKQYDQALQFVNQALVDTPNNPEVLYLKAQILVKQGNLDQAKDYFQTALTKSEQLPKLLVAQIFYEQCRNQRDLDKKPRDCPSLLNQIKQGPGSWGQSTLPQL